MPWVSDAHQKGAINEKKAQLHFMEEGWDVFIPCHGGTRCDFVAVAVDGYSIRVQVKTAQYNGPYIQSRLDVKGKRYTKEDTDWVVFVLDERMWIVPIEVISGKPSVCLGKVGDIEYTTPLMEYEITK